MGLTKEKNNHLKELINQLENERTWLLEKIDRGSWPSLRLDLADLERELGQLLTRAAEKVDENII
tara:strand:- start:492 stop:686 length:195 start_codon:yes stop_codon:yes gene_type:complete